MHLRGATRSFGRASRQRRKVQTNLDKYEVVDGQRRIRAVDDLGKHVQPML